MRGWGLAMASVNVMLEVKSSMFTDGKTLMGINPNEYDPTNGLRYILHELPPNIFWVGVLPDRLWSFDLNDSSRQVVDKATMGWWAGALGVDVDSRTGVFD